MAIDIEKQRASVARWRAANKDRIRIYRAAYYAANKTQASAYQRAYYAANKIQVREAQQEVRRLRKQVCSRAISRQVQWPEKLRNDARFWSALADKLMIKTN
jgi:hypothetical protein